MQLAIVIPAYNAAKTLPGVIDRIPRDLFKNLHSLWIINDGSSDDTRHQIETLARQHEQIRALHLPHNQGYGAAIKVGLTQARMTGASHVACLHADGQYAPESLPELLSNLLQQKLDLLQGSRLASGTALSGGMPLYKYVAGRGLSALENQVMGLHFTDFHSGYLLYGPRSLDGIPFLKLSNSFDFDLEVIASARALGLRLGEHPIPTRYADEVSHLNPVTYGLRVLGVLAKYRRGHYNRRPC